MHVYIESWVVVKRISYDCEDKEIQRSLAGKKSSEKTGDERRDVRVCVWKNILYLSKIGAHRKSSLFWHLLDTIQDMTVDSHPVILHMHFELYVLYFYRLRLSMRRRQMILVLFPSEFMTWNMYYGGGVSVYCWL